MRNSIQPPANLSSSSSYSSHCTIQITKFPNLPPFPAKNSLPLNNLKFICSFQPSKNPNSTSNQDSSTLLNFLRAIPDWTDSMKESGMKIKTSLYGHEDWVHHRSSLRHVRHFVSSSSSHVILSLVPPVIVFTSVAVIIASYNSAVSIHWLPEFFPILRASSLPYQLTAPALALLLVFRTEASYSRFEEGKKTWTKVIAGTNDFARQVIASVKRPNDLELRNALLQYIMAFPVALKCHIINGSNITQDLQNIIDADDLEIVLTSKHYPRCIIEFISRTLQSLDMESTKRLALESKLTCFHEGITACELLMGIPAPFSYTQLTSRFLVLWHFTLPIILWDDCHWIVVPATFISAASLFCIEEVGVLIEEPFPMLDLDELCHMVHRNIQDVMRSDKLIRARINAKRKSHHNKHSQNGWPTSSKDREPW